MFVHVSYFVYFCRTKEKGGETSQQAQIFAKRLSTIARACTCLCHPKNHHNNKATCS